MTDDVECAFCGNEATNVPGQSLKPAHMHYLRESTDLSPPVSGYHIPTCEDCWGKAEYIRDIWVEGLDDDPTEILDQINVDALVEYSWDGRVVDH